MAIPSSTTARQRPSGPSFRFATALDVSTADATFAEPTLGIEVGTAGDVVAVMASDGTQVKFKNRPSGSSLRGAFSAIKAVASGTTATDLVAVW